MSEITSPLLMPAARVAALTGLTTKHLRGMAKRGEFPAGVKCGHRHTMYAVASVRRWLEAAKALPTAS